MACHLRHARINLLAGSSITRGDDVISLGGAKTRLTRSFAVGIRGNRLENGANWHVITIMAHTPNVTLLIFSQHRFFVQIMSVITVRNRSATGTVYGHRRLLVVVFRNRYLHKIGHHLASLHDVTTHRDNFPSQTKFIKQSSSSTKASKTGTDTCLTVLLITLNPLLIIIFPYSQFFSYSFVFIYSFTDTVTFFQLCFYSYSFAIDFIVTVTVLQLQLQLQFFNFTLTHVLFQMYSYSFAHKVSLLQFYSYNYSYNFAIYTYK